MKEVAFSVYTSKLSDDDTISSYVNKSISPRLLYNIELKHIRNALAKMFHLPQLLLHPLEQLLGPPPQRHNLLRNLDVAQGIHQFEAMRSHYG